MPVKLRNPACDRQPSQGAGEGKIARSHLAVSSNARSAIGAIETASRNEWTAPRYISSFTETPAAVRRSASCTARVRGEARPISPPLRTHGPAAHMSSDIWRREATTTRGRGDCRTRGSTSRRCRTTPLSRPALDSCWAYRVRRGEPHRGATAAPTVCSQRRRELGLPVHSAGRDSARQGRRAERRVGEARLTVGRGFLPELPSVHRLARGHVRPGPDDSRRLSRFAQEQEEVGVRKDAWRDRSPAAFARKVRFSN